MWVPTLRQHGQLPIAGGGERELDKLAREALPLLPESISVCGKEITSPSIVYSSKPDSSSSSATLIDSQRGCRRQWSGTRRSDGVRSRFCGPIAEEAKSPERCECSVHLSFAVHLVVPPRSDAVRAATGRPANAASGERVSASAQTMCGSQRRPWRS